MREAQEQLSKMRAEREADDDVVSLFNDADFAIESVTEHEGPVWRERALDAVKAAAERNHTLSVVDVWTRMNDPACLDARAIGGVMRKAKRLKWITPVPGQYWPHPDPSAHGRPLQVWRSNIVQFYGSDLDYTTPTQGET